MTGGLALAGLEVMLPPLVMCLVLTGIHGYLGIHVLSRKVIFVDLALAQIAALGSTCALILGYDAAHSAQDAARVWWFSLGFTLLGAAVFALTRMRNERVPQEAFIGIAYASATAIAVLVLSKSPRGGEHLKEMLAGNILLVRWPEILKTAAIYAGIGLLHWRFRRQFFRISLDPEGAAREGLRVRLWDFLFYASFGVVVTSSVAIAGVLLVFTYLVVPSACAVLLAEGLRARILLAWAAGALGSLAGVVLSYQADLPPGPAVVGAFAVLIIAVGTAEAVRRSAAPARTLGRAGLACALAAALGVVLFLLRKAPEEFHEHRGEFEGYLRALQDADDSRRIDAIHHLEESRDPHALDQLIAVAGPTPSESPVLEHLIEALARFADPRAVPALLEVAARPDLDPLLQVRAAAAVLALRDPRGLPVLIAQLEAEAAPLFAREEALRELQKFTGLTHRDSDRWRKWWNEMKDRIRWRDNLKKFQ